MPQHHVVVVIVVEDGDGGEPDGDAAGLGGPLGVQRVHHGLEDGVVGAVQLRRQGKGALAQAVIRHVALRRDDPVLPADVAEADVKAPGLAEVARSDRGVVSTSPPPGSLALLWAEGHHQQRGVHEGVDAGAEALQPPGPRGCCVIAAAHRDLQDQSQIPALRSPTLRHPAQVEEKRLVQLGEGLLHQQLSAVLVGGHPP